MTFSVSKLQLFLQCPKAFYFIYQVGIKVPKSPSLFYGQAIHEGIAAFYQQQDPLVAFEKSLLAPSQEKPLNFAWEKYLEEGKLLMETYKTQAPFFDPLVIEKFETVPLYHPVNREPLPLDFSLKIDLITKDGFIVDHKSTSSANPKIDEMQKLQAVAYTMAYQTLYGHKPEAFVFNFLIKRKRNPRIVPIFFHCTDDDEVWFFDIAHHVIDLASTDCRLIPPMVKSHYPCPVRNLCSWHGQN